SALPIVVTEQRGAVTVARPVLARGVRGPWRQRPVQLRAGQDVMGIRIVAAAVDDRALFRERILFRQLILVAVEIGDTLRDRHTFGVVPRTGADSIARV